jgi:hypothetical protein
LSRFTVTSRRRFFAHQGKRTNCPDATGLLHSDSTVA